MRRLPVWIFIFVSLLLGACSKTPRGIVGIDKMAEIMAEVHTGEAVVDANSGAFRTDSAKRAFLQAVYERHGVTTEEMDTSYYWYGQHIDKYMEVYDKAIDILEGQIAEAEKSGARSDNAPMTVSLDGDSVNLWQGPAAIRLTRGTPTELMTFSYGTDKNWDRGDRYTVTVRPLLHKGPIFITIVGQYNDGSAEYVTLNSSSEETKRLTLTLDSAKVATNVYGSIYFKPNGRDTRMGSALGEAVSY